MNDNIAKRALQGQCFDFLPAETAENEVELRLSHLNPFLPGGHGLATLRWRSEFNRSNDLEVTGVAVRA